MYPSGRWRGYWEQDGWGRQPMRNLVFSFRDGRVKGEGVDVVGAFTFEGQYSDDGFVSMTKQYLGQHQVAYLGRYDGEGTISGEWSIGEWYRGPFALSPERFEVAQEEPILSIAATPPGRQGRVRPG